MNEEKNSAEKMTMRGERWASSKFFKWQILNLPKSISPKIHPRDHISTPFVYLRGRNDKIIFTMIVVNTMSEIWS